jgi:transposase
MNGVYSSWTGSSRQRKRTKRKQSNGSQGQQSQTAGSSCQRKRRKGKPKKRKQRAGKRRAGSRRRRRSNVRHAQRYRMRKAELRILRKIRNIVDDMHKNLAIWLCRNYKVILLPSFETSNMVRRGQRRIRKTTAKSMLDLGHYRFKQRLLHKAREFPGCTVIICDEHHTSKTCGLCGSLHHSLGGNRVFKCPNPECGFTIDRDVNGAASAVRFICTFLTTRAN